MEFPACKECHEGTRALDAILAWASRLYPDPTTDEARAESRKHIRAFIQNYPDLASMLDTSGSQATLYRGELVWPIYVQEGQRLSRALNAFAARNTMAMYYHSMGQPVPATHAVFGAWRSNAQIDADQPLNQLLQELGLPRTLEQGQMHVAPQFRYWPAYDADSDLFFAFAAFREACGTLGAVAPVGSLPLHAQMSFGPGFLQSFAV